MLRRTTLSMRLFQQAQPERYLLSIVGKNGLLKISFLPAWKRMHNTLSEPCCIEFIMAVTALQPKVILDPKLPIDIKDIRFDVSLKQACQLIEKLGKNNELGSSDVINTIYDRLIATYPIYQEKKPFDIELEEAIKFVEKTVKAIQEKAAIHHQENIPYTMPASVHI